MAAQPNFGPYSLWPSVNRFTEISRRAFEIYHEKASSENRERLRPVHHLFLRELYLAETTSFSIRLLTSWAMTMPALALARVRLEQTIVCSFIVHEDEAKGLGPFVRYIPIGDYMNTRAGLSESGIAKEIGSIDFAKLQAEAIAAQQSITPGFDIEHDKFERKWTKLDLRAMAKRRDELTIHKSLISKDCLERDYASLYKTASSIVHSDCSAISHAYLNVFPLDPDKPGVLMPLPSWATVGVAFTSHYDIIQVFEVLSLFGITCEGEFMELRNKWLAATKEYL